MGEAGRALLYTKAMRRNVSWGEQGTLSHQLHTKSDTVALARRQLASLPSPAHLAASSLTAFLALLPQQWVSDGRSCNVGFHHSAVGMVALGAVLAEAPAPLPHNATLAHSLVTQLAKVAVVAAADDYCKGRAVDTFLNGRAGILFAARFVQRHGSADLWSTFLSLSGGSVPGHAGESLALATLAQSMIRRGLATNVAPGVLGWHDMGGGPFLGVTHGTAGVLGELLFVPSIVRNATTFGYIVNTFRHMVSLQFPTGNFPTEYWSPTDDVLVQWDHGSTGISFAMHRALAMKLDGNASQVLADLLTGPAAKASADVFRRGLLTKGMMLCHGTGATVYSLVAASRSSNTTHADTAASYAASLTSFVLEHPTLSDPSQWRVPSPPSVDYLPWAGSLGGMLSISIDMLSPGGLPSARMTGYEVDW